MFHPPDSVKVSYSNFQEIVNIFNSFQYFVCYDPASFLIFLAALCGCIPILHKADNVSKEEFFKGTGYLNSCFYEYYLNNEYIDYPGIAYGIEDLENARNTIHLLPDYLNKQIKYVNNQSMKRFINDMQNFDSNTNINSIQNNYY
jgi:hypothetical protein